MSYVFFNWNFNHKFSLVTAKWF